jgi:hypothetical protein
MMKKLIKLKYGSFFDSLIANTKQKTKTNQFGVK